MKIRRFLAVVLTAIFLCTSTAYAGVTSDVINGKYGSGAARVENLKKAGYDPEQVQNEVNEVLAFKAPIVANMTAWGRKIAADNRYHYVQWKTNDKKSHTCPLCTGRKYNDHFGWQCIGFGMACWYHGGGLPILCSYSTISDGEAEKILALKTDEEALKYTQKCMNFTEITVIRNKNGIPKNKWQAGDICLMFKKDNPADFKHIFYYAGNGKIIDATQSGGIGAKGNIAERSYGSYRCSVIVRYSPGSVNEIAHEVLTGKWGSGDKRKANLTKAKYDYNKVQARVNELLTPTTKPYPGTMPTLKLVKSNAQVKTDAITWAKWIAGYNRFHYGYGTHAHHNGCYFCGTQDRLKKGHGITDYQYTYCCNPFVGAAWAHGGGIPKAMSMCQNCNSWDFNKGAGYDKSSLFDNLGHPAKSKLQAGDVLCNDKHVALYIGNGKIAEASSGDDNVRNSKKWNNSIKISDLTDSRYKGFKRVHRYNSSVNTTSFIRYGEVSDRVADLQKYINWFYGKEVLTPDRIFGEGTLTWTKQLQRDLGVAQDGIVGNDTLNKMAEVRR